MGTWLGARRWRRRAAEEVDGWRAGGRAGGRSCCNARWTSGNMDYCAAKRMQGDAKLLVAPFAAWHVARRPRIRAQGRMHAPPRHQQRWRTSPRWCRRGDLLVHPPHLPRGGQGHVIPPPTRRSNGPAPLHLTCPLLARATEPGHPPHCTPATRATRPAWPRPDARARPPKLEGRELIAQPNSPTICGPRQAGQGAGAGRTRASARSAPPWRRQANGWGVTPLPVL